MVESLEMSLGETVTGPSMVSVTAGGGYNVLDLVTDW